MKPKCPIASVAQRSGSPVPEPTPPIDLRARIEAIPWERPDGDQRDIADYRDDVLALLAEPTPPTDPERDYIVRADESPIGPPEWRCGWVAGAVEARTDIADRLTEWAAESDRHKADSINEGDADRVEAARRHGIAADTFRLAARIARGEEPGS
jgi:hypothetical protein